jgi:hypothetical protein
MISRASTCLSNEAVLATPHRSLDFTKLVGLVFLLEISLHDIKNKHMLVK